MASSSRNKGYLFDSLRQRWVVATPEEKVRQGLIKMMTEKLLYPKELLSLEKTIAELPHLSHKKGDVFPQRRIDVVCFAKNIHSEHLLYPLLLIECKESEHHIAIAIDQVVGYNFYVQAYFLAVAYPDGIRFGVYDQKKKEYQFSSSLPSYTTLLQWVKGRG